MRTPGIEYSDNTVDTLALIRFASNQPVGIDKDASFFLCGLYRSYVAPAYCLPSR